MADFNIRTDAVDVEQIMRQIRARIQDKRGVDYTEQQIQELATVKLERFLDPKGVRSDLVEQFKQARNRKLEPFQPVQYAVDANDLYGSSRGFIRSIRKLFHPILKLFLNSNRLVQVLHQQTDINTLYEKQFHLLREKNQQRDDVDVLYYELVHNLVLELTRVGIENRNLKMRLESLSSRMDFDERRARALEGVVQFRPGSGPARDAAVPSPVRSFTEQPPAPSPARPSAETGERPATQPPAPGVVSDESTESGTAKRRRRRRRGRRGGRGRTNGETTVPGSEAPSADASATPPHGDPTGNAALDDAGDDSGFDGDSDSPSGDDEGPEPSKQ